MVRSVCGALLALASSSPAAATVYLWEGPASFDAAAMRFAPVQADTLQFLTGAPSIRIDGAMAFVNIRVTTEVAGTTITYRRSLAVTNDGDSVTQLRTLGPIALAGGMVRSISFGCALCQPGAFQGFANASFALIDSAVEPMPQPLDAPVPEPATWLTMLAGFGTIGLMARRRRGRGRPSTAWPAEARSLPLAADRSLR